MWNSSSQYSALATRKLRTSLRPKSKTSVPHSWCSPRRGSACSYSGSPGKRARAETALGRGQRPQLGSGSAQGIEAAVVGAAPRTGMQFVDADRAMLPVEVRARVEPRAVLPGVRAVIGHAAGGLGAPEH